jgi:hypothetical protein
MGTLEPKTAHVDRDFQTVVAAWPNLPDFVRTEILAMIKASGGGSHIGADDE